MAPNHHTNTIACKRTDAATPLTQTRLVARSALTKCNIVVISKENAPRFVEYPMLIRMLNDKSFQHLAATLNGLRGMYRSESNNSSNC